MDINPQEQAAIGRGTEGAASPKHSPGRTPPNNDSGRLRGKGRRVYWVGKREMQVQGRIRSKQKGAHVSEDTKVSRANRVKRVAAGAEAGPQTERTSCGTTCGEEIS